MSELTPSQEALRRHQAELRGEGWREPYIDLSRDQEEIRTRIRGIIWGIVVLAATFFSTLAITGWKIRSLDDRIEALEKFHVEHDVEAADE